MNIYFWIGMIPFAIAFAALIIAIISHNRVNNGP